MRISRCEFYFCVVLFFVFCVKLTTEFHKIDISFFSHAYAGSENITSAETLKNNLLNTLSVNSKINGNEKELRGNFPNKEITVKIKKDNNMYNVNKKMSQGIFKKFARITGLNIKQINDDKTASDIEILIASPSNYNKILTGMLRLKILNLTKNNMNILKCSSVNLYGEGYKFVKGYVYMRDDIDEEKFYKCLDEGIFLNLYPGIMVSEIEDSGHSKIKGISEYDLINIRALYSAGMPNKFSEILNFGDLDNVIFQSSKWIDKCIKNTKHQSYRVICK